MLICNNDKFPYLREDGTVCYKSCDLIPDLGKTYFISSGNLCTCLLFAYDASLKIVCYNNEEKCYAKGYRYKLDNECKYGNEIDCVFKVEGETISGYLKKCFTTETGYINNNCDYYNVDTKLCWASFPLYYNDLTSSNKPGRSHRGNTCGSQWKLHILIIQLMVIYAN